jgi:hypothetical protein
MNRPCIVRALEPGARITVCDRVGMSGCAICAAEEVTIGDCCLLGANMLATASDIHSIADDAFAERERWSSRAWRSARTPRLAGEASSQATFRATRSRPVRQCMQLVW